MADDYRLMVKTALLYYKYDITQQIISKKLGISRQKVGRLLKKARDIGMVDITINSDLAYSEECSAILEELFSLKEAIIIDVPIYDDGHIKEVIGRASAEFLRRILRDNDSLSISWSSTVYQCVKQLGITQLSGLKFSQLNGSHEKVPYNYSGMNILNMLSHCGDNSLTYPLLAPMMVNSREILESLLMDSNIKRAMDASCKSRIALFGIGGISRTSSLYHAGYLDTRLVDTLQECGAVADVCGHFINSDGVICNPDSENRTISISESDLKKKEYIIAVAGSDNKSDAIYGVLNGRWCNVLVTDLKTAEILISRKKANLKKADSTNLK